MTSSTMSLLPSNTSSRSLRKPVLMAICSNSHTGYPVEHQVLSVTVLAESSVWADALASICMVMGMEQSLPLIESMDGVEAYYIFVNEHNELETFATAGFVLLDQ